MATQPGRPVAAPPSEAPAPAAPAPGPGPSPATRPGRVPGSRRRVILGVVGLVVLAGLLLLVRQWAWSNTHVRTDNAQVEGHVVPILPRVGGFVAEVPVEDNRPAREGDLLVRIDDRDLRARLAQAEGDLATAIAAAGTRAQTGQADAQLRSARAAVVLAEANARKAESDLQRYRTLVERGIISRQQLDAAEAAAEAARAQLQSARDQVVAAMAGVRGAESRMQSARAAREQATLMLSYARIAAPVAGVVTRKSVEVGQFVQAGQPLMSVVPLHDVWVVANLKETEVRDVVPGDAAEIEVDSYPGRRFHGHVESLSPATGAKFSLLPPDNATGNFTKVVQRIPVRIRVEGPMDPLHPLRPGMSVNVTLTTRK